MPLSISFTFTFTAVCGNETCGNNAYCSNDVCVCVPDYKGNPNLPNGCKG